MKRPLVLTAIIAVLASTSTFLIRASAPQVPSNTWAPTGAMGKGRAGASAVLLYDGRVLVTGGMSDSGVSSSAERYSPSSGGFIAAPPMEVARANHSSTLLPDGRVLVAGGIGADGRGLNGAEIYDPMNNVWTPAAPMYIARAGHTATSLYDGRILIAGGDNGGAATASLEIYDPDQGVFALAGPALKSARTGHAASLLYDGRVLITGGFDGSNALASTNVYDPYENTVVAGPPLSTARAGHTATTLLDGTVAVIGGASDSGEIGSAEIYDPSTGTFSAAANALAAARQRHQAFLLPHNSAVLIVGGTAAGTAVPGAELFVPWQNGGTFIPAGAPATARAWATGAPLSFTAGLTIRTGPNNGLVLLAGGSATSDASHPFASAELYGFATITTDQADYAPGTTVTIRGAGWKPGEKVTLTLVESPLRDVHTLTPVVADDSGNIVSTEFVPDRDDNGIRFFLTAHGEKSRWEAQTSFTDASGDGTMTVSPATATGGATVAAMAFSFTAVNSFTNSGSQVSLDVPAGWTQPQNSSSGQPGYVSITNGVAGSSLCTSTPTISSITGSGPWTVLLNINCANGRKFTVTYANTTAPATSATPANNIYTFTTKTYQGGSIGGLTPISTQPTVTVSGPGTQLAFTQQPSSSTGATPFAAQPRVAIKDVAGNVMTGDNATQVTLAITSGTGTPGAALACNANTVTAVAGVATFAGCDVDKAGTGYTLTATGNPVMTSATSNAFNITVGAAAKLAITSVNGGSNPTAGSAFAVIVQSQDLGGNPSSVTSNRTITLTRQVGTGTLTAATQTLASGQSQVTMTGVTYTKAESGVVIRASASGTSPALTVGDSAPITVNAGTASKLAITSISPSSPTAGTAFSATVQSQDSSGNASPVSAGTDVTFSLKTGTGTLTTATGTIPAGQSEATIAGLNYTKAETGVVITASRTAGDILSAGDSAAFTVSAGAFVKLQLLLPGETAAPGTAAGKTGAPTAQIAGTAFNVTIRAVDANWNLVSSTHTTSLASTDANSAMPANGALAAGSRTVAVTMKTAGSWMLTAGDVTDITKGSSTSPLFTVTAGAANKLQVLVPGETAAPGTATGKTGSPAAQTAGAPFTFIVNAVDANWNLVSSATNTVSITSSDANAALPASAALAAGTKTFSLTLKTPGSRTITATTTGLTSNTATSAAIPVTVGAFAKLQLLVPGETAAPGTASGKTGAPTARGSGAAFTVTVNAVDSVWNVVSSATDVVSISSTDPSATLPANAALAGGTGQFAVTLATLGNQTITATDATDNAKLPNTSPAIPVVAGAPAKLVILSVNGGNPPVVGSSFPVVVQSRDVNGNPSAVTSNRTITLTRVNGTGTLTGSGTLATGASQVTINATYSVAESGVVIRASSTGLASGDSAPFAVNNPTPVITSISPSSKAAGDPGFTLTISGTGFLSSSAVYFGTTPLAMTSQSATQITATVPASLLTTYGSYSITVVNPAPGGGTSNPVSFIVKHGTLTTVSCVPVAPGAVTLPLGADASCTATVTDTTGGAGSSLNGSVITFSTSGGGSFVPSASCSLSNPSGSTNSCSVTFHTTAGGDYMITANYGGTVDYVASSGTTAIDILDLCNNFTSKLEGKSAGSDLWTTSNLSGWHEQEFIPVRVRLCNGGPVSNQQITLDFDHTRTQGGSTYNLLTNLGWVANDVFTPGRFIPVPSPGVSITPGPQPLTPTDLGNGTWRYTFNVSIASGTPGYAGYVELRALMAPGAHLSPGGSLHITGAPSLGTLQILLPAAGTGVPDLEVHKYGPPESDKDTIITYLVTYKDKVTAQDGATGVGLTDTLPAGVAYVPGTCAPNCIVTGGTVNPDGTITAATLSWNLGTVYRGTGGSVTFQAKILSTVTGGSQVTNTATITSDQNEDTSTLADNTATWTTKITLGILSTSLAVSPASGASGGTATLSATLTSAGSPIAGKTIAFYLLGSATPIGSATTNASGVATLPVSLAGINPGVYSGGVSAVFAGDPDTFTPRYGGSNGDNTLTVTAGFTLQVPPSITYGQTGQASATPPGSGTVTYSAGDSTGCQINSSTGEITVTNASGTCSITASYSGDNAYPPTTSGPLPVTVNKANASCSVTPYSATYDGNSHTATGSCTGVAGDGTLTGLDLSGTTHTAPGAYPTDAWSFAGNNNYNSASGTVSDSIGKATATCTVTGYNVTYDGAAHTATGSCTGVGSDGTLSGLDLSGTTHTAAGTYAGDAWSFTGGANYNDASGTVTDTIGKATASCSVTGYSVTYDGAAHTATGSCTGVGGDGTLGGLNLSGTTHTAAGTYASDAWSFAGTSNYSSASGTVSDSIGKATASCSVTGYTVTYDGAAHTATGSCAGLGTDGTLSGLDLSGTTHTNAGDYTTDGWSFAGNNNYSAATGTVSDHIGQATQSGFSLTVPAGITFGSTGTASTSGGNGGGAVTYSASGTGCTVDPVSGIITVIDASGTCEISASKAGDENYAGPVTDGPKPVTLNKATAAVVVTPYNVTYDGNAHTATGTATGANGADLSGLLNLTGTTHTNAGDYAGDGWSFAGNNNYSAATGTVSDHIGQATQSGFSLTVPASITFGSTGTATTSGGSGGGAVTYSASGTGCTVDPVSGIITVTNASGTCEISATKAGDANYLPVTDGPKPVTLSKAAANIVVTPYDVLYDGQPHTATGTATGASGANLSGLLTLSGTTHTNAGTYGTDAWSFAGNNNYSAASGTVSDHIGQASQSGFSLTVPASISFGSTGTASTSGGSGTGAVTYSASGTGCTVNPVSGVITVTNASGTCEISASKAGDDNYAGPVTDGPKSVTLSKATADIIVTPYDVTYNGQPHTATGTATGVNGADLSALLTLSGTTHTSAGTYGTDAWSFAGDNNYSAASGTVSDHIGQASQSGFSLTVPASITFGSTGTASTSGGNGGGAVTYSASGTGCTVDPVSGVITVINASGTCEISASKAGDENYAGPVTDGPKSVTLNKAAATISVTPYDVTYDGQPHTATGTATGVNGADLTGLLTLSGTTHTNAGTYGTDAWSFAGNNNYSAASGTVSDHIGQTSQSGFSLTVPASITFGSTGTATTSGGNGGGAVAYSASGTGCSVDASTGIITVTNASGTCAITATKAADGNYLAATDGPKPVALNKATATINVTPYNVTYDGNAHTATGTATGVGGADLSSELNLSGTAHTNAGTYGSDAWSFSGDNNYNAASGTVSDHIGAASQSGLSLTVPASITFGSTGTATTSGGNGTGAVTYSASGTGCSVDASTGVITVINASGTCAISASKAGDANYAGPVTDGPKPVTLIKATATVVVTPYDVTYDGNGHTATGTATGVNGANLNAQLNLTGTTHTNAGTYASDAWTFSGGNNYNDASGTVSDHIGQASQSGFSLTVPASITFGTTGTATTSGGSGNGAVTFSASGTGCAVDPVSGVITVTNASGTCWISATKAADADFAAASDGPKQVMLKKANAHIVVTAYDVSYDGNAHTAAGTATGVGGADLSSGLTLNGTTHTPAGLYAGDVWTFAGGNNYNDATGTVDDHIGQASQSGFSLTVPASITFGTTGTATTTGGSGNGAVTFSASGTGCSIDSVSGIITVTNASGTCSISATKAADVNFAAASDGPKQVQLVKANASIVVNAYDVVYDGNAHTATGTATGVNGANLIGQLTLSGTTHTSAGTYASDSWSFSGGNNYNNASGTVSDHIGQASQAYFGLTVPASITFGSTGTATASGGSGTGAVSFSAGASTGCSINATTGVITVIDANGTCEITATKAGSPNYTGPVSDGPKTVTLKRAPVTATAGSGSAIYDGSTKSPAACVVTGAYKGNPTCVNSPASVGPAAGTTTITPIVSGTGLSNFDITLVNGSYTISQAPSNVTVTCPATVLFTGSPLAPCTATVTVTGASLNLTVTPTYSNNVNVGTATASYTYAGDANHTGSTGSANFTIGLVPVTAKGNTGALTIGFWQNKNGQQIIRGQSAAPATECPSATWLKQFAPFQNMSVSSGKNATTTATLTCSAVANWVGKVIGDADASGAAMNAMLKAQMLATALNVYFSDPALGGNRIGAPAPIGGVRVDLTDSCGSSYKNASSAFGGATLLTVSQTLTYAASQSNVGGSIWYGQVKATQELAKDVFDAINNQRACVPVP